MRDLVGDTLSGRYRLVARLAGGGMGEVYRGHDLLLDRPVAVKILQPGLAGDPDLVDRFRAEARAAARLNHPNVAAVYDWGFEDERTYYMVMEYVAGTDLRDVLVSRGALEPGQAVAIAASVCDALAAAHASGLVHRDVKPENVLIARDGAVKVVDFGIAAVAGSDRTAPNAVPGTLRYLSPEQARGEPATTASDVWAAGALLAEMLTGVPPSQGAGADLLRRRAAEALPPPSALSEGVPPELDAVVARACAVDAAERYPGAAAMAAAVRAAGAALPAAAAPVDLLDEITGEIRLVDVEPTWFGATRPRRRRRGALVALVVAVALAPAVWAAEALFGPRSVAVPDLVGLRRRAAVRAARDAGLDIRVTARVESLTAPRGQVFAQDPAGGRVDEGSAVAVSVSAGLPRASVPDVTGTGVRTAGVALRRAGMAVGTTVRRYSGAPPGTVLAQEPVGAARWGTEIDLVVSRGPRPVAVPSVVEMSFSEAAAALRGAGLTVVRADRHSAAVEAGLVVATDPAAGATVAAGSEVTVFVSAGPRYATVVMPDVRTMNVDDARAELARLGLRVRVVRSGSCAGGTTVVETDPIAGARVRENDVVALFVC